MGGGINLIAVILGILLVLRMTHRTAVRVTASPQAPASGVRA